MIFPQNPRQRRTILQTKALGNQNTLDPKMKTYLGFGLPLLLLLLPLLPLVFFALFFTYGFARANWRPKYEFWFYLPLLYSHNSLNLKKVLDHLIFANQLVLILLWPISTPFMIFISLMENFNFILVLVPKFLGLLNLSFHNWSIYQFSWKNPSLAQFIPRIYNKIIIKILGYFWGVTD